MACAELTQLHSCSPMVQNGTLAKYNLIIIVFLMHNPACYTCITTAYIRVNSFGEFPSHRACKRSYLHC